MWQNYDNRLNGNKLHCVRPWNSKMYKLSQREDYESPYQSILVKVFLLDNSVSLDFFLNNGVGMHQLMLSKHIQCILVHQEKGREGLRITELYRTEL